MIKKIGIIGLGLIGGSVARAIKKHDKRIEVAAVDTDRAALDLALSDESINLGVGVDGASICGLIDNQSLQNCDIIIVCTAPARVVEDINAVYGTVGDKALITDVCSVKDFLPRVDGRARYIGGHPMAGTEKSGYTNSFAELFLNKRYIITEAAEGTNAGDKEKLLELIKILGAQPVEIDNKTHDRVLAYVSHLPHIAAYALADACLTEEISYTLGAGGFKDTTRIALSDPSMWMEIILANKENVALALDDFINKLRQVREILAAGEIEKTEKAFRKGRDKRSKLC